MKKFVQRVQEIGNKAAQIKAAIESVPPKIAEMRQAVSSTTSQLQQLRSDVQSQITDLRADTEDKLIETLREIDCNAQTIREAGYELYDVEMELGIPQRLIVDLEKVEEVPHATIRALASANQQNKATHAILSALLKAEALADRVDLTNLTFNRLMVYVGPLPVVRLCWQSNAVETEAAPALSSPPPLSTTAPAPSAFSSSSLFGSSSLFEKRSTPAAQPQVHASPAAATESPTAAVGAASASTSAAVSAEKEDPLARFKKMPDLSRRK